MTRAPILARHTIIFAIQVAAFTVSRIFFWLFAQRDVTRLNISDLKKGGYLVAANHRKGADPFFAIGTLPYRMGIRLLPISFMTKNVFYDSLLRPLIWPLGSYPSHNPKGKHAIFGVEGSVMLLNNGYSVFIFPEGTRLRPSVRVAARKGVIRIHEATPETPILLCHIEYNKRLTALLTRKYCRVAYKLVTRPSYADPEAVMNDIYAL